MKIRKTLVHYCYAVVGLVLLASTPTSAEKEDQIQTSVGLSISGGAVVAGLHGAAIMRGIQQQKVEIDGKMRPAMEAFDYMAGLSGGNIPIVLYAYARTMDSTEFLDAEGEVTAPQDITAKKLRHTKRGSLFDLMSRRLALRVIPVILAMKILKTKPKSVYNICVYYTFIKPIGIKRNKFFGPTELGENKDFVGVREDVKATPIITFGYVGPKEILPLDLYKIDYEKDPRNPLRLEAGTPFSIEEVEASLSKNDNLTPVLFSATPFEIVSHYDRSMSFDTIASPNTKMTVEPLDFPVHPTKPSEWGSKKNRFSLEMLLGVGTNMFSVFSGMTDLWQFREVDVTGKGDMRKLMLADGGTNVPDGIASLVQKRVRKIVHVNFNILGDTYAEIYKKSENLNVYEWMSFMGLYYGGFSTYFGISSGDECCIHSILMNKIFDDGVSHMEKLRSNLDSLFLAENPLVTTLENITVLDNPFWGTTAGDKVDLTFILMNVPGKFSSKIQRDAAPPPEGIENIVEENVLNGHFTNKELSTLPNIQMLEFDKKGIIARGFRVGGVTVRQANMMAYLGSWIVDQAWDKPLLGDDGEEKFGGFKMILDKNGISN